MLARNGKFLTVDPFFGPGPRTVVSRDKRYDVGDLVLLGEPRGGDRAKKSGSRRPQVQRRLGRPDVARDVIGALLLDRGADKDFDAAVQREARTAATEPLPEDPSRTDLRELATFTIDPVTARDFDDAISAQALPGGGWRVWVHIADVAAYVRPRSLVDREGYRRATSVYVPGTVAPMLPGELSNGACSLVPGEDRPTVTVEMTIGATGVRSASFSRSLIRSDARLDYDARRPDLRRHRERRPIRGASRWPPRAGPPPRSPRCGRAARRSCSSPPSRSFASTRRGTSWPRRWRPTPSPIA